MKRLRRIGMILAFLAVCAGALLFLLRFTQSAPAFTYPAWETGAVVSPSGEETPFDPAGLPPDLGEGEAYRFTLTLPAERAEGTYLVFEAAGLAVAAYLDGQEVWRSSSDPAPETANQSQVQLPLPAGGGEALVMEVRPLSALAILPPLARLSADPTDQAGAVAYANYYGLPAGATALALVLLWGLFLLGLSQGKGTWPLLLPTLAAALLTAHRMALGYGNGFLPQPVQALLSAPWLEWVAALALVGFLVLHRERAFWKALGIVTAWSAGGLAVLGVVSHIRGGYLARYLEDLILQIQAGVWSGALYWLIWWLVLVCTLLSAWDLARFLGRTQGEARALALKNQLVMENYRALEQKLRESAQLRHGFAHQVTALDAMVQARDWAGLERWVAARKAEAGDQSRYTEHIAVNAILQDAAARARGLGIPFQVSVAVPRELFVPDEDLCALLMNLLDNALEGAARTPPGREKGIFFQMRVAGNFLPILCENTFDGQVNADPQGRLQTRKDDPASHGFGLAQMRAVAEKYSSVLDISWTEERFTVQTALQNPLA